MSGEAWAILAWIALAAITILTLWFLERKDGDQ